MQPGQLRLHRQLPLEDNRKMGAALAEMAGPGLEIARTEDVRGRAEGRRPSLVRVLVSRPSPNGEVVYSHGV